MPDETLLLPTKLHPPALQAGSVLRARLVDTLLEQSNRKIQLVVAPAGYGKTTLLTDFATDAPFPLAWLTLDPADRDPHSFIEYLVAALRTQFPDCGESTLRALTGTPDIAARSAALARTLAADVYANVPALCLLVLDDFQEVNDSAVVTGFLDELLRLLPENLRIVLASRTRPSLAGLTRLAVGGELAELDAVDLRFSGEEVMAFLERRGAELSAEQADELAARSEGWIAGLLLSAHALQDGAVERMIRALGHDGPVFDYLAEVAYKRQPSDVRGFLLASSIPRVVDASICEVLLGTGPWLETLEDTAQRSLFLARLPGESPSFRYHQLFREFLQSRLQREQSDEFIRLHLVAAELMASRSEWQLALDHYQEAGSYVDTVALLSRIAPQLERAGRWFVLAQAIDAIPGQILTACPHLLVTRARVAALIGDAPAAKRIAGAALNVLNGEDPSPLRAEAFQVLGRAQRSLGQLPEAMESLQIALGLEPESPELKAEIQRDLGITLGTQGRFAESIGPLSAALSWFEPHGSAHQTARTEIALGTAHSRLGRPRTAVGYYVLALDRWRELGAETYEICLGLNNLAYLYYLQGETALARRYLAEGLH